MANRVFENMAKFRYFGAKVANHEEIKKRLNLNNAWWFSSDPSLLVCCLKIFKSMSTIVSIVLYSYETWSLTLREEHKLKLFQNKVLRRRF
jgi:hypothetical protein